ncbi:hypothetical protein, partial [Armatimonas sp.]|uniref:hypothetical protein n=1 Tax=Armatimonas sp. TaxID=1872638 RepID=UPI003750269B
MPHEIKKVFEQGRLHGDNVNIAFFVLSPQGDVLRAGVPFVQPGYFRMNSEAMGADMVRQLKDFFTGLELPTAPKTPREPVLPDINAPG